MYRQVWNQATKRWDKPKKLGVQVTSDNRHLYEFKYGKLYENFWKAWAHTCCENQKLDEAE